MMGAVLWSLSALLELAGDGMKIIAALVSPVKSATPDRGAGVYRSIAHIRRTFSICPGSRPVWSTSRSTALPASISTAPLESDDAWHHATQQLYAHGCTGFLIALVTNREEGYRELLDRTDRTDQSRSAQLPRLSHGRAVAESRSRLIAARTGPNGCRSRSLRLLEEWRRWRAICSSSITLAPEIDPEASVEVIRAGRESGIEFFLGHSGAMGETLDAGGESGRGRLDPSRQRRARYRAEIRKRHASCARPTGTDGLAHSRRPSRAAPCFPRPGAGARTINPVAAASHHRRHGRGRRGKAGTLHAGRNSGGSRRRRLGPAARPDSASSEPVAWPVRRSRRSQGVFRAEQMAGLYLGRRLGSLLHPARLAARHCKHGLAEGNSADFCLLSPEKEPYFAGHLPSRKMRLRGAVKEI